MAISTSCFQGRILQGCPTVSLRLGFFVAVFSQLCARVVEKMSAFVDKSQKDSVVYNLLIIGGGRIDDWEKPHLPCLRANSLAVFSLFSSFPFYTYLQ